MTKDRFRQKKYHDKGKNSDITNGEDALPFTTKLEMIKLVLQLNSLIAVCSMLFLPEILLRTLVIFSRNSDAIDRINGP